MKLIMLLIVLSLAPALAQRDSVKVQLGEGETTCQPDGPPLTERGPSQREYTSSYQRVWSPLIDALGGRRTTFR